MTNHPEDYVLQLSESDVRRTFRRVKAGKAAVPDGVPPCVFKTCMDQLAPVFSDIFNASLQQSVVPVCFKDYSSAFNTIIPSKLVLKLRDLGLGTPICNRIMDFLTGRPQVVTIRSNTIGARTTALH